MSGSEQHPPPKLVYLVPPDGIPGAYILGPQSSLIPYNQIYVLNMVKKETLKKPNLEYDVVLLNDDWLSPNGLQRRCLCFFKLTDTQTLHGLYGLYKICDFPYPSSESDPIPPAPVDEDMRKQLYNEWIKSQPSDSATHINNLLAKPYPSQDLAALLAQSQAELARRFIEFERARQLFEQQVQHFNAWMHAMQSGAAASLAPLNTQVASAPAVSAAPPALGAMAAAAWPTTPVASSGPAEDEEETKIEELPPPPNPGQPPPAEYFAAIKPDDETTAKMSELIIHDNKDEFLKLACTVPYDLTDFLISLKKDMNFDFCVECLKKLDSDNFSEADPSALQKVKLALIQKALSIRKQTQAKILQPQLEVVYAAACTVPNVNIKAIGKILGISEQDEDAGAAAVTTTAPTTATATAAKSSPPATADPFRSIKPPPLPDPAVQPKQKQDALQRGLRDIVKLYTAYPDQLLQALYEEGAKHLNIDPKLIYNFIKKNEDLNFDLCLACLTRREFIERANKGITQQINSALLERFFDFINDRDKQGKVKKQQAQANKSKINPQDSIWNFIAANNTAYFGDDAALLAKFIDLKKELTKKAAQMKPAPSENIANEMAAAVADRQLEERQRIAAARAKAAAMVQAEKAREAEGQRRMVEERARKLQQAAAEADALRAAVAEAAKAPTPNVPSKKDDFARIIDILDNGTIRDIQGLLKDLQAKETQGTLTKLLARNDSKQKNLLMLALERLAAPPTPPQEQKKIDPAEADLVFFLIDKINPTKICDKDIDGNSVLHYWAQRDFSKDLESERGHAQQIFDKLYKKYKDNLPQNFVDELATTTQGVAKVEYKRTIKLLQNKAGDTFLQQLLKHPSNIRILDHVFTYITPGSDIINDISAALFVARDENNHNIYFIIEKLYMEYLKIRGQDPASVQKMSTAPEPLACHKVLSALIKQYRLLLKNIYVLANNDVRLFGNVFFDLTNITGPDALVKSLIIAAEKYNADNPKQALALQGVRLAYTFLSKLHADIKHDFYTELYQMLMSDSLICLLLHSAAEEGTRLFQGVSKIVSPNDPVQHTLEQANSQMKDYIRFAINPAFEKIFEVLNLLADYDKQEQKVSHWHEYTSNIMLFSLNVPPERSVLMNELIKLMTSKCELEHTEPETANNLLHEFFKKINITVDEAGDSMTDLIYDETCSRIDRIIRLIVEVKGHDEIKQLFTQTNAQGNTPLQLLPQQIRDRLARGEYCASFLRGNPALR